MAESREYVKAALEAAFSARAVPLFRVRGRQGSSPGGAVLPSVGYWRAGSDDTSELLDVPGATVWGLDFRAETAEGSDGMARRAMDALEGVQFLRIDDDYEGDDRGEVEGEYFSRVVEVVILD